MAETKARFLADTQKADTTAEAFTWPTGRASQDNYVLAMSDKTTGATTWQITATAPTITGVSGELNVYENSTEDGGVLTLTGTDFGSQSEVDSIKIMDSSEGNKVTANSFTVNSETSISVTFNGTELGYNSWGTGGLASTNWYIQVTKSGLNSNLFSSGKSFTKDPTISSVAQTVSGDNNGTLTFNGTGGVFGSYGGTIAGGGQDSNTKLLLNFDRVNGSTDVEDSSNTGSNGHKITVNGTAVIKSSTSAGISPAMAYPTNRKANNSVGCYFDGNSDYLSIPASTDFHFMLDTSNYHFGTIEAYIYPTFSSGTGAIISSTHTDTQASNYWSLKLVNGFLEFEARGTTFDLTHSDTAIPANQWTHVAVTRTHSGSTATFKIYVNGAEKGSATKSTGYASYLGDVLIGAGVVTTGGTISEYFQGYIDHLRFRLGSTSSATITPTASTLPTQIYGAFGPENPSIGSIEITTATDDDVNVTYSFQGSTEDNASVLGTSSDLAIASDTTGANKKKGVLTGTLQGNVGSVTNLRIQAKANNDANRLVEVNETSGVGAIRLDKTASGVPVLFNARRYIGTSGTRDITGYGFQPDLVWFKTRNQAYHNALFDSVRGTGKFLESDRDVVENTNHTTTTLTQYNVDGFELGTDGTWYVNRQNEKYIAWAWKAGGAPVSITSGLTGASSVTQSASSTTRFSITKYTGASSGSIEFPHNLGGIPEWILIKKLDGTGSWLTYHKDLGAGYNIFLDINSARTGSTPNGYFGTQTSTNIVLTAGGSGNSLFGGGDYICYAWKAVSDVSAFGDFTIATGNTGYTLTGLGFKPRLVVVKKIENSGDWHVFDSFRSSANPAPDYLNWNANATESTYSGVTCSFDTNGFTLGSYYTAQKYIYMAFA